MLVLEVIPRSSGLLGSDPPSGVGRAEEMWREGDAGSSDGGALLLFLTSSSFLSMSFLSSLIMPWNLLRAFLCLSSSPL